MPSAVGTLARGPGPVPLVRGPVRVVVGPVAFFVDGAVMVVVVMVVAPVLSPTPVPLSVFGR